MTDSTPMAGRTGVPGAPDPAWQDTIPLGAWQDEPGRATDTSGNRADGDEDALIRRLEMLGRHEEEHARAQGPPRLLGLVLVAWGVLLALAGLIMLTYSSSAYYLFCGVASGVVGALLMRCSRWAMPVHGGLLLAALLWAWLGGSSALLALLQAAPLLVPALWVTLPAVRGPLR